jgi:tetratricopeptide (TPR) repeat protein
LVNAGRVQAVLTDWRKTASADAAPLIAAAEVLIGKAWYEAALEVLREAPRTLRTRQLGAFAKRKQGLRAEALDELEALRREDALDAETAGLLAGTYKAHWLESGDLAFRRRAYETYREAYERSGDPFNGINAAAMALQCGDESKMHEIAGRLIADLGRNVAELDYWRMASLGEAYLLKKRFDDARDWYGRAAAGAAGLHEHIAVMRRQARMNLDALGQPRGLLDAALPVPRVLAYTGHRTDAPDRNPPRFAEAKVSAVRLALREKIKRYGALHGFGGAAAGTDILVLKELVARSLTATVVLPFPRDDFVGLSVGSGHWKKAFDDLTRQPGIDFMAPLQLTLPPREQLADAFAAGNLEIQRRAIDYAKRLDEVPVVIAVWDGKLGDGPGGTADTVNLWRFEGYEVDVIDVTAL